MRMAGARDVSRKVRQGRKAMKGGMRMERPPCPHLSPGSAGTTRPTPGNEPFALQKPAARLKIAPPKAGPKGRENTQARDRPSGGAASCRAASPRPASGSFCLGGAISKSRPRGRKAYGAREGFENHGNRFAGHGKAGGMRMGCRGAGGPPARLLGKSKAGRQFRKLPENPLASGRVPPPFKSLPESRK